MYHNVSLLFLRLGRFENLNSKLSWIGWGWPTQYQLDTPTQPGNHSESSISQAQSWRKALEVFEMCLGLGRLWENGDVGFGFRIWRDMSRVLGRYGAVSSFGPGSTVRLGPGASFWLGRCGNGSACKDDSMASSDNFFRRWMIHWMMQWIAALNI